MQLTEEMGDHLKRANSVTNKVLNNWCNLITNLIDDPYNHEYSKN